MIIGSSHLFGVQSKLFALKQNVLQPEDKAAGKFTIPNEQAQGNVPIMDTASNRDLLMQMLAANAQVMPPAEPVIRAVGQDGQQDAKRENGMAELAAPLNLTAMARDSHIILLWDSVSIALGYNVKRSTMAGGPYTIIAGELNTNSFTDTAVDEGITYYYVVTAVREQMESVNSSEASVALPKRVKLQVD